MNLIFHSGEGPSWKLTFWREDFLNFRKALEFKNESYENILEKSIGMNNPNNIAYLSAQMGIGDYCTLMDGLK